MRIDVVHVHEEAGVRDVRDLRGIEVMFRHHTMQPDCGAARADLAVDGLTLRIAVHTRAVEAERPHQEIVRRGDILIGKNGYYSIKFRHDVCPFMSA